MFSKCASRVWKRSVATLYRTRTWTRIKHERVLLVEISNTNEHEHIVFEKMSNTNEREHVFCWNYWTWRTRTNTNARLFSSLIDAQLLQYSLEKILKSLNHPNWNLDSLWRKIHLSFIHFIKVGFENLLESGYKHRNSAYPWFGKCENGRS